MSRFRIFASALLLVLASLAAPAGHYTLAEGAVGFTAPDAWLPLMEKTEGARQFRVFRVPNPAAPQTLVRASVLTQRLQAGGDFPAFVQQTLNEARSSTGFSEAEGEVPGRNALHFQFVEDGQMQVVRLGVYRWGEVGVVLRCQRPRDMKADAAWLADYRRDCDTLARHLGE